MVGLLSLCLRSLDAAASSRSSSARCRGVGVRCRCYPSGCLDAIIAVARLLEARMHTDKGMSFVRASCSFEWLASRVLRCKTGISDWCWLGRAEFTGEVSQRVSLTGMVSTCANGCDAGPPGGYRVVCVDAGWGGGRCMFGNLLNAISCTLVR